MIDWYKKVLFENYANFSGRARRSEYWYYALCNFIISLIFYIPLLVMSSQIDETDPNPPVFLFIFMGVFFLYSIATLVPTLAVTVRRLHDTGKSGWTYFISLIPIVGPILLLVYLATDGEPNDNKWGKNPKSIGDNIGDIGRTVY